MESMKGMKRSHYANDITEKLLGQTVTVMGWVNKRRYLSGLIFIVVRDRTGIVQIVIDEKHEKYEYAKSIRGEYVIAATGKVIARTEENINPDMVTGKIEIDVDELRILSESEVPPFQVADENVAIDLRLKHRYIDMRRAEVFNMLKMRHTAAQSIRTYLSNDGYIEVETPTLINSSPEGARDYLVPSRTHPGQFYALPQSPQLMKQILMIGGLDKYFQIAKCYRDEDLRADRQPEFTQVDIELSFADEEDVFLMTENLLANVFKDVLGIDIQPPFLRMTWHETMERFGTDKPDLRYELEIKDISNLVKDTDFGVFQNAISAGGSVRGIAAPDCADMPRKQIDALVDIAKSFKAKGLAWIILNKDNSIKSTLSKFFDEQTLRDIAGVFNAKPGDLVILCADKTKIVLEALGAVRVAIAKYKNLADDNIYKFLWVTEMPLLEYSEEDERYYTAHHPFTSPMEEDEHKLESDPGSVRARAYDIVLNGYELGGGSIRIHRRDLQDKMFKTLGFTPEQAQAGFGYFLEALKYGVPPHGGIAMGFDRIVMLLAKVDSLREVMAFPKLKDASCPMTHAPSTVDNAQLEELGITYAT